MNNISLSSINSRSSQDRFKFPTIRDSIFYYEDLMGPQTEEKEIITILNEECYPSFAMNVIFDEAMLRNNHTIENKERELKIKQLLESIDTFHQEDPNDF
jgi:hypothetical protein